MVGQEVPVGRLDTAKDLTGMAVSFASADSGYVVAQTHNVDGETDEQARRRWP